MATKLIAHETALRAEVTSIGYNVDVIVYVVKPKVDRTRHHAWRLRAGDESLACRLASAVEAGVVFTNFQVLRDIYGKTYLQSNCSVLGRRMNADLRRLGF